MNVIVLSMERCACSWFGGIISGAHQKIYGEPIYWNYEISRMIAIDNHYCLPLGYSSVYYIKLEWLLEKNYDKIIVLKRDLDILKEKLAEYYNMEMTEEWIERIEFYYDLVFNHGIQDERVMEVYNSDISNYSVATFSKVLDFLEFDTSNLLLYPIMPPERDFEKFASILGIGHEEGIKSKDIYSQYVNEEKINPYKISPEEYVHQRARVFRLKPSGMNDILKILKFI